MAFAPRPVRWLFMLMAGWLVLAAMRNAVAGDLEVGPLFDRYVHDAVLLLAGALCVLRAVLRREERLAWALIGAGVLAWTLGEIYYTGVLWTAETVPLPSPADVGYLLMPPLVLAGLIVLLRGRTKGDVPGTLRADGLTAALAVGAVSAAIVFDTALGFAPGDPLGIATVLSYPIGDLVLGGFVIGALARAGWRLDRTWFLLGAGILTFWLADSLYLVEVANGTFESGSWFDAGWWVGLTLIAAAAWQPLPAQAKAPQEGLRLIVMPLSFGTVGLGLLIYGCFAPLNALAVVLAAAALLAVMVRLIFTFRENVQMLHLSRDEALTDALTGLPNRRALTRDLDRMIPGDAGDPPLVLALFDLDGFKLYNDTFGHPAGDALLDRLATSLRGYLAGRGTAYRMGGDEFCALFNPRDLVVDPVLVGAASALSEHGEGFSVTCSHGSVLMPIEATDASEALRVADRRMYARKNAGRTSASRQSKDVLVRALAERNLEMSSHATDVAALCERVARHLALPIDLIDRIRHAAELHDIGKVAIPDEILTKPGELTEEDWTFIRRHTLIGERIVAAAPALTEVAALVRSTHEHWDGSGYPDGLAGADIPLGSRIISVADSFSAMTVRPLLPEGLQPPSWRCASFATAPAPSSTRSSLRRSAPCGPSTRWASPRQPRLDDAIRLQAKPQALAVLAGERIQPR